MGNFYTNVTVKAQPAAVAGVLRARRRDAFIASAPGGMTVVVDRQADEQDLDVLASLALTLAATLGAPALAALNHDDDALVLALYDANGLVMEHGWSNSSAFEVPRTDRAEFIAAVRERFATQPRTPAPQRALPVGGTHLLLRILNFLFGRFFAIDRHQRIVDEAGMPAMAIGAGYNYVAQGDGPPGTSHFERV